jgi:spore coat polysaccharide biosynthesis predicted glycosyltransferase SpsG/RimJ/RimL family protein N-acetyltransferase
VRLLARADASRTTGFGHVVRTLAVLEQAQARGHDVLLVGDLPDGWVADLLRDLGVERRPAPASWDDLEAVAREWGADAVHVDHYGAPAHLRDVVHRAGAVLVNVEDGTWGRRPADVVLDQTWGSERAERPDDGSGLLLRGGDHVLVRAVVRRARVRRAQRAARTASDADRLRCVVVMGGSDATGALRRVVSAVAQLPGTAGTSLLAVGAAPDDVPRLEALPTDAVSVEACGPRPDLPDVMAAADVVVSAAGTTAGELCCIGTPMALVAVVDNQQQVLEAMTAAGVAVGLGSPEDLSASAAALAPLLSADPAERDRLSSAAVDAVDGTGAALLLAAVERLVGREAARAVHAPQIGVRAALAVDALMLLRWRNDDEVRRWSREQDPVPEPAHRRWLAGTFARADRHLLVAEDAAGTPVGTARWDLERGDGDAGSDGHGDTDGARWEVSITLAPDQRGRGLSRAVLAAAEAWLADREPAAQTVVAAVHTGNAASQALFRRAGYAFREPADAQGFERFDKPLRPRPTSAASPG